MLVPIARLFAAAAAILSAPRVRLPTGATVSGKFQTNGAGHVVQVFQGIPYAEPPVGELRWKQTTLKPITNDLNATAPGNVCSGYLDPRLTRYQMSEDCLFLNVYAPAGATKASKLPVMVWVHGGGFVAGTGNEFDCSDLVGAGDQKLVVVTINYRLSVFGFLSNEEILSEGNGANFGLRDQEIAFEWVKEYISYFGGNPHDLTAFGESAGAWSLSTHLVSREGNQQLFQKAIIQSGGFLPSMSIPTPTVQEETTIKLAAALGCTGTSGVLKCLRAADANALAYAANNLPPLGRAFTSMPLVWGPTVDGVFILGAPIRRLQDGKFSKIPTIMGSNTDEGWGFVPDFVPQFESYVRANYPLTGDELTKVATLYPPTNFKTPHHRLAEIYSDLAFVCTSELVSTLSSATQPAYRYRFNYTSTEFGYPLVVHAKELDFVFNRTELLAHDEPTNTTAGFFETFWTNFARYGTPNEAASNKEVWPQYNAATMQRLVLQPSLGVETTGAYMPLHDERCAFWLSVDQRIAGPRNVEPKQVA